MTHPLNPVPTPPTIDVSAWPLVRIVFHAGGPDLVDPFISELLQLAGRGPFVTVADGRRASLIDAATRKRLFAGFERVHATGMWRAEAIVLANPLLRGIATAYSWVRRADTPLSIFNTMDAAESWMKLRLHDFGQEGAT